MPIYNYKGKEYSIPEDQVKNFESKRPDATVSVTRAGEVYDLPLSERDSFFSDFNDASYYDPNNVNKVDLQGLNNQSIEQSSESTRVQMPDVDRTPMSKTEVPEGWQQDSRYKIGENGQPQGYTMLETEDTVDENGVRHMVPKRVKGADGTDVYRNAMTGEEYNPMSAEGIEMAEQNKMNIPQSDKKRNDPSLIETIGKSLGAGFTRLGAGMIDAMQQLSSGMIVEVGNGEYMRMPSYEETLNDKSNAMTKASDVMHETADRMSAEAQPYGGQKGFLDLLWDGEIGKAAQKGVATAGESLPMTLSAFNPYTMVLNAISMAGGNYREEAIENPDVPAWKRATYAIGQAAIEQAVEKYADPVFKYIGGTKVLGRASKDASKEIVDNVTKDATETLAKRIYHGLGGLMKDAAGEGTEEVITNFGNDILGEALDLLDGDKDYGIRAQWEKLKKENPDADLYDFAMAKAKENVESFIGGAMAGAYTSGTAQLSVKALEYTLGGVPQPNAQVDPVSLDVAQSYDEGMNLEDPNDKNNAKNMLDYQRNRLQNSSIRGVIADALDGKTDAEPLSVLINMIDSGAYTDEEKQLALDFLNAKATYNGMIERVKDNIDEQIHESDITIDARVNRNGSNAGSIVGGTMKLDDRKVYVIDGDVKMFDDGSMVDNANSSESVLVMDAETGKLEFVSPNDILSVDAPIDAEQEKEAARNAIRESVIAEQTAIIDGILPFNPGDEYSLKDEQGNSFTAKVVQSNEDGTVLVSLNGGEPQIMAKEMLQGMSDAENLSRLAEYQAGKTLKETEDQLENGQQPTTDVDGAEEVTATEQQNADGNPTDEQIDTVEEENGGVEPMPMIGKGDNAEPDFMAVAPERGYKYLYEESGLSQEDVATFVQNNVNEAEKALTKIDGKKPNIGTSISKYNKDMAEWNNSRDAINRKLEYWKKMQSLRNAELQQRAEEQRKKDAEAHDQAVEDLKQYDAEQKRKAEEQAAIGTNAVAPGIKDKWDASTKVEGLEDSIVLPNGETINGRYMLVESGAASASHDANNGFTKTEGFPIDENGGSVNDRDYERDKDAQRTTREIANNYDQRAVQTPVVVSGDGVVLSGNGRTMAGELAAAQNTDGAYIDYVRDHAGKWGFTSEQVSGMQHPRVVFVPADNMPYTADTFAKFNAQEMKSQSKTEQAVKMGKVVDDATFGRITKRIGEFDTIGDFYADNNATAEVIGELQKAGVVSSAQMAEMFDGDGISNAGKDLIENVLIGKAFESNPDALRQLTEFKSLRQSVMTALSAITDNAKLGEDYSLIEDLAQAIDLAYKARIEGGYNAGDRVSGYARQMNLGFYGEEMTVADVNNIMLLILADAINDSKVSLLKHTIRLWNERAQDAANGQLDLFTGEVPSRDSIINEVKELFKYDSRNEKGPDQTTNADRGSKGSKENGEEVKPVGNSAFGEIFTQFKGNVKAAIAFLLERKQGNAVAALHHPEVGDIDLWYGNDKAGLKKISKKHPEVLDNLQEIIDGMRVVSHTDNRIKLESDTHFAVVSKDWLGEEKDNWLLTAYEKKKKGSSDGTMDIGSEPGQGKQNGTAPLQTPLENEESSSRGKGTNNSATEQENTTENVEVSNVSAEKEGGVDKSKAPWYGTIDEAPATDGLLKSYREELFEEGQSAYSSAYQKYVPMAQFGVEEVKTEPTYEEFVKEYTDRVGDYSAKKVEKYLPAFYEYFKNKLSEATKKNSKKNEPQSTAAEETKTGKDSAKKQPNTVAKSDQKSAVAKEKIEDVGEEIAGARKDIRMKIAKTLENISVKSLVELPFAKAYKKPDLKKAVEEGALRESDAVFYDAFFNTVVNAQKPHTSKMEDRRRRYGMKTNAEKWAEQTYKSLSVLKEFIEADEARRDEIIKQYTGNQYLDVENDEIILAERKRLNPDTDTRKREWGNKWTPSPLWVTYEVMKRLGYKVGDKLDIPYGIVLPNSSFTGYSISNAKGETAYGIGSVLNIEDAIDKIVWLAKLKRGDADTQNPMEAFYFTPTKKDMEESGRYRVAFGSGMNVKWQEFDSKDEADEFVSKKKNAIYIEPIKTVSRQYGYVIGYRNPLSQERTQVSNLEFETKSEAEEYLQDHYEELNAEVNKTLVKDNAEKKEVTADDVVKFGRAYVDGKWVWSVYIDEKYANNMGMIKPLRDFDKKEDAKAYADEVKDSVFKAWKSADEARKNFVYFSQGEDTRVGEDYRGGKDVTAEEFMNTFGFRGVQFGNWTDQEDRQMAINQAYDAMMDMANLLGMTPKAMSLNGELGIAFGSRGSGSANAHYELNEVVINLTKTRGAGSLAHEWWHALDNYFARAAGNPLGMVTKNGSSEMRAELRNAFQNMLRDVMASNYYKRSMNKGAYWGSIEEVTARLLAEWVNHELKKKGHLNTFLSRGANVDNWIKNVSYPRYLSILETTGTADEPMSIEEFAETEEALNGFQYPSAKEVERFGDSMRAIFDTIQEREDNGKVVLFQIADVEPYTENNTEAEQLATEAVMTLLNETAGLDVVMNTQEEGQLARQNANAEFMAGIVKAKINALNDASRKILSWLKNNTHNKSFKLELPSSSNRLAEKRIGHKIESHVINANEIIHARKQHGLQGKNNSENSIPLRDEDFALCPYIMASPTRIESGTPQKTGQKSIRYVKEISNGTIVCVEVEGAIEETHMANITMWAEKSPSYTNAMVAGKTASYNTSETAIISSEDAAKIRKDAETAIENDVKSANSADFMTVWHGSAAIFDQFDGAFMGTGEGNQAYGVGHYVSNVRGTGELYAGIAVESQPERKAIEANDAYMEALAEFDKKYRDEQGNIDWLADGVDDAWEELQAKKNEFEKQHKNSIEESKSLEGKRQLYEIEIPDDNGKNYLGWEDTVSAEEQRRIEDALYDECLKQEPEAFETDQEKEMLRRDIHDAFRFSDLTGGSIYGNIISFLGDRREASNLLNSVGYVGFKVQTGAMNGGDGRGMNYVIFNDADLNIKNRIEFLENNGTVYGWSAGNRIHLTPEGINPNTPIHEYTHLWAKAVQKNAPKLWDNVKNLLKGTPIWDEVVNDPAYHGLTNDDEIASEALSRMSGRKNAERMLRMAEQMIEDSKKDGTFAEAKARDLIYRMRDALKKFWQWVGKNLFDIEKFGSVEEVTDRVLYDLVNKTDLHEFKKSQKHAGTTAADEAKGITETPEFKNWFKDSKIVDKDGNPLVVYHGATLESLYFKDGHPYVDWIARFNEFQDGKGFFTPNKEDAKTFARRREGLYECYLSIQNPFVFDCKNNDWDHIEDYENPDGYSIVTSDYIVQDIMRNHPEYDGVVLKNVMGENSGTINHPIDDIIPFRANQIKSADGTTFDDDGNPIPTNKRFSESKDIRYRQMDEFEDGQELMIETDKYDSTSPYTIEGLSLPPERNVARLLTSFREKYPQYCAMLNDDQSAIVVTPWAKMLADVRKKNRTSAKAQRERAAYVERKTKIAIDMINEQAQKLGLNVEVKTDTEGLIGRRAKAKGWYDVTTGKIVVVLPNHVDGMDVMRTLMHEAVGHYGMRKMFGKDFDTVLDNIYANSHPSIRRRIAEIAARNGWNFRVATEEYMAGIAEDIDFKRSDTVIQEWWNHIRLSLMEFINTKLREIGFVLPFKIDNNDLRLLVWRSYENMANADKHGVLRAAEVEEMKQKTGVGYASDEELERADAAVADDSDPDDDPNGGGIRFRDGEDTEENGTTEEGSTETPEEIEDVPLSLEQSIIHGLNKLAEKNKENIQLRLDAVNAIGGELSKLRKAMSAQKEYDRWTVDEIAGMARVMIKDKWFDNMTAREVMKLLSLIKGATGKVDLSKSADGLYDMLVESQLRRATSLLHNISKIHGGKVNAQGVNVQGQLDTRGQIMMKAFNEAIKNRTKEGILERIAEVEELMDSKDDAIAHNAVIENEALMLALQYISDVKGSIEEETELNTELKDAKAKHKSGEMSLNTYQEYVKSVNDALRQNKLERIDAMNKFSARLAGAMRGSIDAAKQFNEQEKARVENIHHYANSDLQGVPADAHRNENWRQKLSNNPVVRFLFNPLGTFDQMMRMFGRMSVNGEGYLYNHFMRSWVDASNNEFKNYNADCKVLDDKVSEVFGEKMRWSDLYSVERSMPKAQVEFLDHGEKRTEELRQGNLLYIYMANKMADGKMKLRKMGITEEDVAAIKKQLDPRFITLADWLQEDFLKQKRNDFNKVHERMFGAPMDAIENYFPLKIAGDARIENVDVSEADIEEKLPSVLTGSIIKRRRNSLALDIMNADAFSVVIEHLQSMEKWAAFAEWRRDLNTLLSYKNFRNKVKNMSSVYGGGENLWHNFMVAGSIAAGTHRPKVDMDSVDTALVNVAKGVTAAKISLRLFTAVKQRLSSPAFMAEADLKELAKSQASPWKSWNWAMENLPTFRKRWESKKAGDNRLMPTNADWEFWKNNIVETLGRWGMSPNAFVDAMTIAIGAKAMYETKLKRYLEDGYTQDVAEEKAKQDAAVLFNQTQQSSENAFLSKMQLDRTVGAVAFTVFRNSSFSYTRQYVDAIRELKRMMTPGYKEQSIAFMTKQMVRDGLSEAQAAKAAERAYRREWTRNISRLALFGYVMQFAWDLGPYMPYIIAAMLIGGGDDDEMKKMLEDAAMHATIGSIEGLTAGNVMSDLLNMKMQGESWRNYSFNLLPLVSDIQSILTKYDSDNVAAINDIVNLVVQAGVGVNPQTIEDAVVAIMDACDNDASTGREAAMLILRLIQAPQSSIDKLYVDELAMNGEDAKNLSVQQMAERYAKYKKHKGAAMTEWLYDEDQERAVEDKYIKRFEDMAKDRLDSTGNLKLDEAYDKYDAESKAFKKMKLDHVNGLKDRDPDKYDDEMDKLEDTDEYEQYMVFKAYDAAFRLYMRLATRTNDVELRDEYLEEARQIKQEAVIELEMLKSGNDEDRRSVLEKYSILVNALNEQDVEL